jgi:hypothetical protein
MPILQLPLRPPPRRLRAVALLAAISLHLGALLFVTLPIVPPDHERVTLLVVTDVAEIPPLLPAPAAGAATPQAIAAVPGEASAAAGSPGAAGSRVAARSTSGAISAAAGAIPFLPDPSSTRRGPSATAMTEARAAALPLIVRPGGGLGGRSLGRTPEQLAIARAESLLVARLAGIAVVERRDTGALGLADGGVTLAIPWPGFLPANRGDERWREERCSGDGGGDSDKAGEGEARRAQCD